MLMHQGAQLAQGVRSVAARSFYTALWRWSKVTCPAQAHRIGRRTFGNGGGDHGAAATERPPPGKETALSEKIKTKTEVDKETSEWASFRRELEKFDGDLVKMDRLKRIRKELEAWDLLYGDGQDGARQKRHGEHLGRKFNDIKDLIHEYRPKEAIAPKDVKEITSHSPSVGIVSDRKGDPVHAVHPTDTFTKSVRILMRSVTQPVAVVTTTAKQIPSDSRKPQTSKVISDLRGMTISSFTTVTLEPEPIISFNIHNPSSTLEALKATRCFFIHFPTQTSKGREIAQAFAKGNVDGESPFQEGLWALTAPPEIQRKPGVFLPMPTDGTLMSLRCEVLGVKLKDWQRGGNGFTEVGDHTIVLAKVFAIEPSRLNIEFMRKGLGSVLCYEHGDYVATTALNSSFGEGDKEVIREKNGGPSEDKGPKVMEKKARRKLRRQVKGNIASR